MPLLSIVITVYNLKKYIAQCLDSVVTQDFDDYEVVLVDNGSTDGSRDICKAYAEKYKQIRYIQLEGEPVLGRAHIIGQAEATGIYIHMVDGDDYLSQGCYIDIMKILSEKSPDVLMGRFICDREDGALNVKDAEFDAECINGQPYEKALQYLRQLPGFHMVNWRYIYNKQKYMYPDMTTASLKRINKPNKYGDESMSARILIKADTLYFYDKPFYYYRKRKNSVTNTEIHPEHYISIVLGLLYQVKIGKYEGERRKFLLAQAEKIIKLFSAGNPSVTHQQIYDAAAIICQNKDSLTLLCEYTQSPVIDILYRFIKQYGNYEGLYLYCMYQKAKLLSRIKGSPKNIYVLPTGNCGEMTAKTLEDSGLKVKGFLDNDTTKDGLLFNNLPCCLPEKLNLLCEQDKSNTLVVISTIYPHLNPILKSQLLGIGLDESQIVIKE